MAFVGDSRWRSVQIGATILKTFSGNRASQIQSEIQGFIQLLLREGVRAYGEIGARHGDSFYEVLTGLPGGSKGVACDLPEAVWGAKGTREDLERAVNALKSLGYKASAMFGDSKNAGTIQMFRGRGPYDAILIDGDHTYEGVSSDWNNYRSMARLIAFHDIVGFGQSTKKGAFVVEVPKLWKEIKAQGYKTVEFVAPGSKMGIGVVYQ
jgi:hypothetical protein